MTGDTVLEQSEVSYDVQRQCDPDHPLRPQAYRRGHGRTLHLLGPRGVHRQLVRRGQPPDGHGRLRHQRGQRFSRPEEAPARSDTVLVTATEYNAAGMAYKVTDPAGKESRSEFDDAGRTTKQIDHYVDGNPATGGSDEDVTVEMAYNSDGQLTTLTAKNPTTGDQVTKYVYGTSVGGITPLVYRQDLLRAEIYPDSDDTLTLGNGTDGTYDRIEYLYNIQGDRLERKDQIGSVHTYE